MNSDKPVNNFSSVSIIDNLKCRSFFDGDLSKFSIMLHIDLFLSLFGKQIIKNVIAILPLLVTARVAWYFGLFIFWIGGVLKVLTVFIKVRINLDYIVMI